MHSDVWRNLAKAVTELVLMAYRAVTVSEFEAYDRRRSKRKADPQIPFSVFAFASVIPMGVWMLYSHLTTPWINTVSVGPTPVFSSAPYVAPKVQSSTVVEMQPRIDALAKARIALKTAMEASSGNVASIEVAETSPRADTRVEKSARTPSKAHVTVAFQPALLNPALADASASNFSEATAFGPKTEWNAVASTDIAKQDMVGSLPTQAAKPQTFQLASADATAPLPRAPETRVSSRDTQPRSPAPQPAKLASAPAPSKPALPELFKPDATSGPTLAYAPADAGVDSRGNSTPAQQSPYDGFTAVYDITGKTVYMPDGTRLEAHSGLGQFRDDPRHVEKRMRGATPPHTYDLKLRESLFHGVQAIRLTPVGGQRAIFNRDGLLAHTYMLGPNGDSNGCVSFKNYNAFLQAFLNKKVKRLIVVDRLRGDPPGGPATAKRSLTASAT